MARLPKYLQRKGFKHQPRAARPAPAEPAAEVSQDLVNEPVGPASEDDTQADTAQVVGESVEASDADTGDAAQIVQDQESPLASAPVESVETPDGAAEAGTDDAAEPEAEVAEVLEAPVQETPVAVQEIAPDYDAMSYQDLKKALTVDERESLPDLKADTIRDYLKGKIA